MGHNAEIFKRICRNVPAIGKYLSLKKMGGKLNNRFIVKYY
jgi:hypothetical protein